METAATGFGVTGPHHHGAMTTEQMALIMAVAGEQSGVLTTAQAAAVDVSATQVTRLVRAGVLERRDVGVLQVAGWPSDWEQRLWTAYLRAGDGAVVSHRSAARLWEIEGFDGAPIELSVPTDHRRRLRGGTVRRTRDLDRRDLARCRGFWVTNPARTVVDLGGVVSPAAVEVAVDDVLRRGLTTVERLAETTYRLGRSGRSGPATTRELLVARRQTDGLTDSGFETKLLRILREAGLPAPRTQHVVRDDAGRFVMRLDAAYVDHLVGIEADSERWHMSRKRFLDDRTKRATAESLGWRILAFTHHHVTRQTPFVAETVRRALGLARLGPTSGSEHRSVR